MDRWSRSIVWNKLTVSNTSATGAGTANNVVLSTRNATIAHVVCNDQKNQLHLFPHGLAELNTSYAQKVIIGEELLIRKALQIGTSQDTARLISALDSTMVGGDSRYITLGRDNSSRNQAEIHSTMMLGHRLPIELILVFMAMR